MRTDQILVRPKRGGEGMNAVQELIDENVDKMPVALAKTLLDACKAEAEAKPKLYKVTVTRVDLHTYIEPYDEGDLPSASAKLFDRTQTLIVEAIDQRTCHALYSCDKCYRCMHLMLDKGLLREHWLDWSLPRVSHEDEGLTIVHAIVPFEPRKRVRGD